MHSFWKFYITWVKKTNSKLLSLTPSVFPSVSSWSFTAPSLLLAKSWLLCVSTWPLTAVMLRSWLKKVNARNWLNVLSNSETLYYSRSAVTSPSSILFLLSTTNNIFLNTFNSLTSVERTLIYSLSFSVLSSTCPLTAGNRWLNSVKS